MVFSSIARLYNEQKGFFYFSLKYLSLVGLWPEENWSKLENALYSVYATILHILSIIYLIITGIGTYHCKDDVPLFLSNLDKCLVAYHYVSKILVFIIRRRQLRILINEIEQSGDKVTAKSRKLMCVPFILITVITTAIVGAFSALAQFKGEMLVEAWMPFDPMKNRINLALSAQILAIIFVVPCMYRSLALQGVVSSIILYLCDQLIELQERLRALKYSKETEEFMRQDFKEIVQKHVRVIGYSKSMTAIFKEFFLIQNLAVTVELCLNAMMVTVVGLENKILLASFLSVLGMALLNAYVYCYLGNELIIQSQGIALAAYETGWASWPLDMQKNLITIIRVSQKPLQLSAGGMANMSIQTFGQALYNGYSIFAVLNDVVD